MISLRLCTALLILSPLLPASAIAEERKPCEGFRYLYADRATSTDKDVKIYGCRELSLDGRKASQCEGLGEIDLARLRETQKKAVEEVYSYIKGLAVGMSCFLAFEVGKLMQKPGALAIRTVDGEIGRNTAANVHASTQAGRRRPGEPPNPGDVNKTVGSTICTKATSAAGLSFRQGVAQAMQMGAMPQVYQADARHVWSQPSGAARRKAFEEWQERLRINGERQRRVLEKSTGRIGLLWRYMTSEELSDLPFGTSTDANVNPNSCIPGSDLTRFLKIAGNFRKVVNETSQSLQDFQPHQGILVPAEDADQKRQLLGQRVPEVVQGVNQFVPAAQTFPTLPPMP